jgi:uncharacterized protein
MSKRLELFVVLKGHAFSRDAFEAMLRSMPGTEPTFVDQPAAAMLLNPDAMRRFDAILFYDMPGLDFRAPVEERPAAVPPEPSLVAGFNALLVQGKGMVALHHAIAGWPAWYAYAEALGGAFLYKPGAVRGVARPDSRYAADVAYRVRRANGEHPVLAGIPESFELVDEPYIYEVFDDGGLEPLLYRDTPIAADRFLSARQAVRRETQTPWEGHDPAPNALIGWAKAAGNSPVVYLQPGDGPATYAHPHYRTLVGNAIRWVSSPEGQAWAKARHCDKGN